MTLPRFTRLNVVWELPETWCERDHLREALAEVERQFAELGLAERFVFVVTSLSDRLPLVHRDRVIVLQTSDEGHEIPSYSGDVFMVFKNYRPFAPMPDNLRVLPLGCNADVPAVRGKPMAERATDLFFIGRPEFREEFFASVAAGYPEGSSRTVRVSAGPGFCLGLEPADYAATLADTRIALAPRGVSHETFRIYEALRAGCAVIAAQQLPAWFTAGWPVIELDRWAGFEAAAERLLADPAALDEISRRSFDWWRERCSPRAVGRYMAQEVVVRLTRN